MPFLDPNAPTRLLHWIRSSLLSKDRSHMKHEPQINTRDDSPRITAEKFLEDVQSGFLGAYSSENISRISRGLKAQFRESLQSNPACMLPSYNHKLATGGERGRYVALDLGGSTFRVAIIELRGNREGEDTPQSQIVEMEAFRVGTGVKNLVGTSFFDWMASRVIETLKGKIDSLVAEDTGSLPLALTWSFPVEQTSPSSGRLQAMGKAFRAADGLIGQDLGALVETACSRAGLAAEVRILLNDSSATLISRTYTHPSTRFGLILGTGVNVAGYLPLGLVGREKLGGRPQEWLAEVRSVVINSELSMFGKGVLPRTRWDESLSWGLPRPGFQPLENMVSGMYLGEILRLVLVEAIEMAGMFGGVMPEAFRTPYSLGTELLSMAERFVCLYTRDATRFRCRDDIFIDFEKAFGDCQDYPYKITASDSAFLRSLSTIISRRSAVIVAASIHAFWDLRREELRQELSIAPSGAPVMEADLQETIVAFTGSVIESYPGYLGMCQKFVNDIGADSAGSGGTERRPQASRVKFISAKESSLIGAGVALAATINDQN